MPTIKELEAQLIDIQNQIVNQKKEGKIEALRQIKSSMSDYSITLDDIQNIDNLIKSPKEKKIPVIKYRVGNKTWSGKGRKPEFIKTEEANGNTLESMRSEI